MTRVGQTHSLAQSVVHGQRLTNLCNQQRGETQPHKTTPFFKPSRQSPLIHIVIPLQKHRGFHEHPRTKVPVPLGSCRCRVNMVTITPWVPACPKQQLIYGRPVKPCVRTRAARGPMTDHSKSTVHRSAHTRRHQAALLGVTLLQLLVCSPASMGSNPEADPPLLKGPLDPTSVPPLFAVEMPSILEVYAQEVTRLETLSEGFLRSYQRFILTLDQMRHHRTSLRSRSMCLAPILAQTYVTVDEQWLGYHRQARKVRGLNRQMVLFSHRGYTVGLTPDLQVRLENALTTYDQIRQEHITLKSLLVYQVEGEIDRLGCSPEGVRDAWKLQQHKSSSAARDPNRSSNGAAGSHSPNRNTIKGPATPPTPNAG